MKIIDKIISKVTVEVCENLKEIIKNEAQHINTTNNESFNIGKSLKAYSYFDDLLIFHENLLDSVGYYINMHNVDYYIRRYNGDLPESEKELLRIQFIEGEKKTYSALFEIAFGDENIDESYKIDGEFLLSDLIKAKRYDLPNSHIYYAILKRKIKENKSA